VTGIASRTVTSSLVSVPTRCSRMLAAGHHAVLLGRQRADPSIRVAK
jgi:hypothetical protein